jgi:hypothetical protein
MLTSGGRCSWCSSSHPTCPSSPTPWAPHLGAVAYDALHTEVFPIALGVAGVAAGSELPAQLALIWLGHIGMDRTLGYGLKYPTAFKDTHLNRV